jgi:hypothetical protein
MRLSCVEALYILLRNLFVMKILYPSIPNLERGKHLRDTYKQTFVNLVSPLMCKISKQDMISPASEYEGKVCRRR